MNNSNLIEDIRQRSSGILEKMNDRTIREFKIKDLDIDNGVYLRDMPVRGSALNGIMTTLKVRRNFTDLSKKMSPEDWKSVAQKLKTAEAETKLYAHIVKDSSGIPAVEGVLRHNGGKKRSDDASYQQYIDWICDSLGKTEKNFILKDFNYINQSETIDMTLLNQDNTVDVFGTNIDLWKMGERFTFNSMKFDYAPFFERLVCANGNTAKEYGFGANIAHTKFNNRRIESVINKAILFGEDTLNDQLQRSVQHLQQNNVSISEFNWFKGFFESRNENGKYDSVLARFFNDQPFYKAYGVNIAEKSRKWKAAANTGINAYDFFNMLTWIASHPGDVRMEKQDRIDMQIHASSLLFKKELDLEDVPSPIEVNYPRITAML
jgi:hypothetical protein